jgi:hypothetical protein
LGVHADSHTHTSVTTRQVHTHEQARSEAALRRVTAEMIGSGLVAYGQPARARVHGGVWKMGPCRKTAARRPNRG